jgi:micrococcal nuclease
MSMVRTGLLVLLAIAGFGSAVAVARSTPADVGRSLGPGHFKIRAKVVRIVDGDTIVVRYAGRNDRVRLIGIDTPEVGQCYSAEAAVAARRFAGGRAVRLLGDKTQSKRDRFGRLLAYVMLPDSRDLGRELLRIGMGVVYVFDTSFSRLGMYRAAELQARATSLGVWGNCGALVATTTSTSTSMTPVSTVPTATTATTTISTGGGSCAPSYPGVCIAPPPPDLDCGQIAYQNFRVRYDVAAPDPHRFDGDRDGIGCEK